MSDTPKRRWFHFSIRDIILVTVIVAVCVAWWVDRQRLLREIQQLTTNQFLLLTDFYAPAPNPPQP